MRTKCMGIAALVATSLVGGVMLAGLGNSVARVSGSQTEYKLTLTSENAGVETGTGTYDVTTTNGNAITLAYEGASAASGAHIVLASGGTLKNTTLLTGVKSIKVTYTGGTLNADFYAGIGQEGNRYAYGAVTSGVAVELDNTWNGFKFTASGDVAIESVEVSYLCTNRFTLEQAARYEAEDTFIRFKSWDYGTGTPSFYKQDSAASGGVYLGDIWDWVQASGTYQFDHYAHHDGAYTLRVRYATGFAGNGMGLVVNGDASTIRWSQTPGWGAEAMVNEDVTINLHRGYNHIELSNIAENWVHLDYYEVIPQTEYYVDEEDKVGADMYWVSAENTNLFSATTNIFHEDGRIHNIAAGFGDNDGNGFEINTYAMNAGTYKFIACAWNANEAKSARLWVNSQPSEGSIVTIPATGVMAEVEVATVTLQDGNNRLSFGRENSWCNFDYFKLVRVAE